MRGKQVKNILWHFQEKSQKNILSVKSFIDFGDVGYCLTIISTYATNGSYTYKDTHKKVLVFYLDIYAKEIILIYSLAIFLARHKSKT